MANAILVENVSKQFRLGKVEKYANTQYGSRAWTIMQVIRTNGSLGTLQSAARRALSRPACRLLAWKRRQWPNGESWRV